MLRQLERKTAFGLMIVAVLWIAWCIFTVETVVPFLERHLRVYRGITAWALCILPVLCAAAAMIARLKRTT